MNLGVNLADYQNGSHDGMGLFDSANTTPEALSELSKALEAGSITGRDTADLTTASGAALKIESLEKNLKLITFRAQDIRLWKNFPKSPAYNTVEEYNQLVSYGADRGGFNLEGELPEEEDSTYVRRAELVKFLGVTKSVTHPMQLVSTHIGNIIQREVTNGTMWILRKANRSLAFGDATVVPQEWNGLYRLHQNNDQFASLNAYHASDNVIDLKGASLTQETLADAANTILENFGFANMLYAPPKVTNDLAKDYYEKQRILLGTNDNGVYSSVPKVIPTTAGDIELQHDIFLKSAAGRLVPSGATSLKAPNAPVAGGTPKAVAVDGNSQFATADAGDYLYAVAAVNRYGESALTPLGNPVLAVAAGESVDLSFTDGGGANPATGYVIYRSVINPTNGINSETMYPIFSVSVGERANGFDGGAANFVRDRNRFIANTNQAFVIQMDEEVVNFKQLAPLMKMELAVLSPSQRFMILLYGTPQLYAPLKMTRIVNIGDFVAP